MISSHRRSLSVVSLSLMAFALVAHAQAPEGPTRLTTEFRGNDMCLDVVNGGPRNNQVWLDNCSPANGQSWTFEPVDGGAFRMHTEFRGDDMCLDVNPSDNRVEFRACGAFTGQFWRVTPGPNGTARLTTQFRGPNMCLDIVNGGPRNNFAELRACGNFTGQRWNSRDF